VKIRPVAALAACLTLAADLALAANPEPERIRFDKGKSAATIRKTLKVQGNGAEVHRYLLRAAAGQVLTVRFEAADPHGTYFVTCPGNGPAGASGKTWSMTLPEAGDLRITVVGSGAAKSFPYTLEVGIEGKPHPVAPEGLTGTWRHLVDPDNTIEIRELSGGKLKFAVHAFWKGASWKEYGPNIGEIGGTAELHAGKAVFEDPENQCVLTLGFTGEKLDVGQEGNCGFGMNVSAEGAYERTSLCAAPEDAIY